MKRKTCLTGLMLAAMCVGMSVSQRAEANNMAVTNVALQGIARQQGSVFVKFDLSWDNSWRASWLETNITPNITITNWDAAWVFVKYRVAGGNWQHASLSTNNSEHVAPAGSAINVGLSTNAGGTNFGAGVFIYRSAEGSGSWTNTGVKLWWNYQQDGVASTAQVNVSVLAIEMVYVPEGSFYVGDGSSGYQSSFTDGSWISGTTIPFRITSDAALTISNAAGCLWGTSSNGSMQASGPPGVLSNAYPKGFAAFYCMKHELTQGQYTDFLNMLTATQASNRYYATNSYRYTISGTYPNFTNTAPDRVCNLLNWADGAAYADWAGLRPMTELEYEKACRGPKTPVANECAWGTATIIAATNFTGTDGSGTETALPASANCNYNSKISGSVRAGIFATASSTRANAGATYWGIMEMTGNQMERAVTVGNSTGRSFNGAHGDGVLSTNGNNNVASWSTGGTGYRGGAWHGMLAVSDRFRATYSLDNKADSFFSSYCSSCRAVRSESSVVH